MRMKCFHCKKEKKEPTEWITTSHGIVIYVCPMCSGNGDVTVTELLCYYVTLLYYRIKKGFKWIMGKTVDYIRLILWIPGVFFILLLLPLLALNIWIISPGLLREIKDDLASLIRGALKEHREEGREEE